MRSQRIVWTYHVLAILFITYGVFFAIRTYNVSLTHFIIAIVAMSLGVLMLLVYYIFYLIAKKKRDNAKQQVIDQTPIEVEPKQEEVKEEKPVEEAPKKVVSNDVTYVRKSKPVSRYDTPDDSSYSSGYVKQVGYGPVLEINGGRIRDMRRNVYYRVEGNRVYIEGSGLAYEISGGVIRTITGNQLYQMSGNSIYRVYGGFFASISGNYITKYDSSEKYETTCQLSNKMMLVVAVLVFGEN